MTSEKEDQEQTEIIVDVEKLQAYLEMASLFSDNYFKIFLQNQKYKPAQFILRTILNNPFLVVQNITIQKVISNIGGREVNLDFYCEEIGENGKAIKRINVEIQNESSGAIPKRARFHSSSLDSASLKAGDKFKDLSENYVIFISKKDIFKQKQALYNIQRYIEFTDEQGNIRHLEPFGDDSYIIYINGEYKDTSNDLGKIIHDFHCVKADEMLCEELKKPAEYLKNKKKGVNEMFELYQFLTDESQEKIKKQLEEAESKGIAEGEKIGEKRGMANAFLETAKNLLKLGIPNDKIAEATKLSLEEVQALSAQMV